MKPGTGASGLLEEKALRSGAATSATFQITDRCNYDCTHCYQEHDGGDELSTEEALDILEQLAAAGILFLTVMGGEVFMRPDADELLQRAHELGFAIRLKTTGHHVTDKRAKLLASLRPLQVDLSVYSDQAHVHERVTGQQGSWRCTVDAAARLIGHGVKVDFKAPVMEENSADLAGLVRLAKEVGAEFSFDPKVAAMDNGDRSPLAFRMSADTLKRFYGETMAEHVEAIYSVTPEKPRNALGYAPCGAAQQSCFINPQGQVWPCLAVPMPVGDLRRQSFEEIWRGSEGLEEIRALRWASIAECNACPVREYCQRCHGMALVEHGVLRGPSLEACRHAVAVRDALRERGAIPKSDTALPPTWDRIDEDGQHDRAVAANSTDNARRSKSLRIL